MSKNCHILQVSIDTLSESEILTHIHRWIDMGTPHQIVTVNTEFVMAARQDAVFRKCLLSADLALADGAGIILAAKLLHQPIPPRLAGVDFVQTLANESTKQGYSVYLLGGQGGVAKQTSNVLQSRSPGLKIVGVDESSPEDLDVIKRIKICQPDILLVAWGAPKQDVWINLHKHDLNVPVMIGVGGTFDFLAGKQKRAPKWMRDFGLEWLWRLLREPKRWRRQLALPHMFILILLQKLGIKID